MPSSQQQSAAPWLTISHSSSPTVLLTNHSQSSPLLILETPPSLAFLQDALTSSNLSPLVPTTELQQVPFPSTTHADPLTVDYSSFAGPMQFDTHALVVANPEIPLRMHPMVLRPSTM
ncbi:hypothetical protein P3X46_003329 [Hevea brasiliensis]|uniref:Uncharacterized protein n=1 Tax=Hevea brasiliensis TaxID=3981 RepID=A0ABQ9N859_HEVBR|nr:hypothetical protein P3X46_003329 [Hevea brasiliensis]